MSINVKFVKDSGGFITGVDITKRGRKTHLEYDKDQGFTLDTRNLDPEVLSVLKMLYPVPEKQMDALQEGLYVQADATVDGGNTTTILYTIPSRFKLYILNAFLSNTIHTAAGAAWGGWLYVYDIIHGASLNLIGHAWHGTPTVGMGLSDTAGFVNYGFPAGFQIRMYTAAETYGVGGFMGLLL